MEKSKEHSLASYQPLNKGKKTTIISSIQKKLLGKKEPEHGPGYKFDGSDEMLDQLIAFIKQNVCTASFSLSPC